MIEKTFSLLSEAGTFLKRQIEHDLRNRIQQSGHAILILPGGNSIKLFFPYLLEVDVPWRKITIGLSDERCVPTDHDMSNEKQLKEHFLNLIPNANYCSLNQDFVKKIQYTPPVTVLSMGIDGHVASLFPEESIEWEAQGIGIYTTKKQKPNRITMTQNALLTSSSLYILTLGKEKDLYIKNSLDHSFPLAPLYYSAIILKLSL